MAIHIFTQSPDELLPNIVSACQSGKIMTWSVDEDDDFTHTGQQWKYRAWFRPRMEEGELIFNIVAPRDAKVSSRVYAVYHGRFVEMLLKHFDAHFDRAVTTAMPEDEDAI